MSEVWKPVVGFEGLYEVSDQGRVRSLDRIIWCEGSVKGRYTSLKRGRLLRPGVASNGYPTVMLGRRGGTRTVHSLVAEAFLGPCPIGQEVRHRNGSRLDAAASNLEYGTRSENNIDSSVHDRRRVKRSVVAFVKTATGTQIKIAAAAGISRAHVHNIQTGKQRAHG